MKTTLLILLLLLTSVNAKALVCNGSGQIKYTNALYVGECKNNKHEGQGVLTFDNGSKYDGNWKNSKKDGQGTQHYVNGVVYRGEWKNNKYNGKGTLTYNIKEEYAGYWIDGKKNGQGIYFYSSGAQYKGEWKDDKKDGEGVYHYSNGAVYSGEFKDNVEDGFGSITFKSGDKYVGYWKKGKKNGEGILSYANGAKYDGMWVDNKKQGRGVFTYKSGTKYEGQYKNNKKNGQGIMVFKNGVRYDGSWKNGTKSGQGRVVYANGDIYDGTWSKDEKHGRGSYRTQYGITKGLWSKDKLVSVSNDSTYEEAYLYFNKIRLSAGMSALASSEILQNSAQNHVKYIAFHNKTLEGLAYHGETQGKRGFTGSTPKDRAQYEGYLSNGVGEGIAHNDTAIESINGLMTAIYHRFGILDFTKDEVGIGFTQNSKASSRHFVHNTGNSKLNFLCKEDSRWVGKYYSKVCKDAVLEIKFDLYVNAKDDVLKTNPKYVVWPPANSTDNLCSFAGEVPDPMPDFKQTGNPISIEFNPFYFKEKIWIESFKLYKNGVEVTKTRILTKKTDPNEKFTSHQFALFPLEVLDKDTRYEVEFKYQYEGEFKYVKYSFKTMQ